MTTTCFLDLAASVREQLDEHAPLAAARGLDVRFVARGSFALRTCRPAVRTIVDQLLRNAFQHAPERSTVEVALAHRGTWFELRVTNRAPDLERGDVERLFERFWRKRDHAANPHLGLGLSFCL